jgi:NADP-dependent 3-hydroxy acid dehydrogenase YdfG
MRKSLTAGHAPWILTLDSDCEPLTPEDIAEVVVFAAGRRENVVIADTLIFPSHQVSDHLKYAR